jgi:dephospho-CoA kinase
MRRDPYCVALTGGIASGKTAVADRFAELGAGVIDADIVARELVAPNGAALSEIVAAFGADILDKHGALDRQAMRTRVFEHPDARRRLEAILHPRIRSVLRERSRLVPDPYALLVIPLLVESGHYDWVDRVLVVDASRDVQRSRLIARDHIAADLADAMLDAQASREQRLAIADDIISNEGTLAELELRVVELHTRYVALANARART